jgi:CelD/BcsL family acetyltransferase involved in cellulose biosynthesis
MPPISRSADPLLAAPRSSGTVIALETLVGNHRSRGAGPWGGNMQLLDGVGAGSTRGETCRTPADLEALRPEWAALWSRCPGATTFQRPEWLIPWCRLHDEGELLVTCVRADGELVAVLPLRIRAAPDGTRLLTLVGEGSGAILDALVLPGMESVVSPVLEAAIVHSREAWDVCELEGLPAGATLLKLSPGHAWQAETEVVDSHPVLDLPADGLHSASFLSERMAGHLAHVRRNAEERGGVEVQRASTNDREEVLEAVFRLQEGHAHERGGPPCGAPVAGCRDLYDDTVRELDDRGALRLYALRHEGAIIAAVCAFREGDRLACHLGGFDPGYARFGAATLLLGHIIEEAAREGCAAVDFLRGRYAFKYRWGAQDRLLYRRRIRPRRLSRRPESAAALRLTA